MREKPVTCGISAASERDATLIADSFFFTNPESRSSADVDTDTINHLVGLFSPCGEVMKELEAIEAELRTAVGGNTGSSAVHSGVPGHELALAFRSSEVPDNAIDFASYARLLTDVVAQHSINMASPRCLGHMTSTPPPFMHAVVDFVVRLNQNLVKADASRVLTLIERQVLAMMHRLTFRGSDEVYSDHEFEQSGALGILSTGGTLANLTALWCARNASFPAQGDFRGVEEEGIISALRHQGYEGAAVVGSELMHYSIQKSTAILGLGSAYTIEVPVDGAQRVDLDALRRTLRDCSARHIRVIALVGLAGSTDCGSIDPLADMAEIALGEGVHFHVDAAGCGGLLFSSRHRELLTGIELADSVTLDCHKQFCLPVGSGALLLRDPASASVLYRQAPYMLHNGSGDLGKFTLEGSRPGTALLIHAALNVMGHHGFAALADRHMELTARFADRLVTAEDFELLQSPQSSIVLYRYLPRRLRARVHSKVLTPADNYELNAINEHLQRAQYRAGRSHVSRTTLKRVARYPGIEIVALRAVINNFFIRSEDLEAVLEDQRRIGTRIENAGAWAHPNE